MQSAHHQATHRRAEQASEVLLRYRLVAELMAGRSEVMPVFYEMMVFKEGKRERKKKVGKTLIFTALATWSTTTLIFPLSSLGKIIREFWTTVIHTEIQNLDFIFNVVGKLFMFATKILLM